MGEPAIHGYLSINSQGGFSLNEKSDAPMAVKVALESLKELGQEKPKSSPAIDHDEVVLVCRYEDKGIWVQAKIKVAEIAKVIGLDDDETKHSIESGRLPQDIASAISKQFGSEIEITSEIKGTILLPEKSPISRDVKRKIEADLTAYGLTKDEFNFLVNVYGEVKEDFEKANKDKPFYVGRNNVTPHLPRSLVYVPKGTRKGCYILLKSHEGVKEVGVGGFNTVTLCIWLDKGEVKGFRTGLASEVQPDEAEIMALVADYPEDFVGGISFEYDSTFRARDSLNKADREIKWPKSAKVRKCGSIIDLQEGGELYNSYATLKDKQPMAIAISVAKSLSRLHQELHVVHFDLKTENIVLTKEGLPLICDFGLATKEGAEIKGRGTPGYRAPEVLQALFTKAKMVADPKADMWSFGCILAILFHGGNWVNDIGMDFLSTKEGFLKFQRDPAGFDANCKAWFPEWHNPDHVDYVIYHCLKWDPNERFSADTASVYLEDIAANQI